MNLKLRPMAEAPLNDEILLVRDDGTYAAICIGDYPRFPPQWIGFYLIADLLEAARIVDGLTPEGYLLTGSTYGKKPDYDDEGCGGNVRTFFVRAVIEKLSPPVRYEFVTDGVERKPLVNEWVLDDEDGEKVWKQLPANIHSCVAGLLEPQLCYRRVEVKP